MQRMLTVIATFLLMGPMAVSASSLVYVAHGGGNAGAPHGGEIGTIDLDTGEYSPLTSSLGSLTSLVFNGTSLFTYETQSRSILEIDPSSGSVLSSVGSGVVLTDMAYDPTTGRYFGVGTDDALYQIDIGTGAATYISAAAPGRSGGFRQIAFSADGTLYMHATNTPGEFFVIDPSTGAILSTITGGVPGGALGLGVSPETGLLIASECCGSPDGSLGERLFAVDPSTGTPTLLFDFDDGRRMQDFAFAGTCGDGIVDPAEDCDGGPTNGTVASCCSASCAFVPVDRACDDGDACTQADACDGAGTCVGADPVTCTALDQCHEEGTCDPATGTCSNPTKPEGAACDDGDACTAPDVCRSGTCEPGPSTLLDPLADAEQTLQCVVQTVGGRRIEWLDDDPKWPLPGSRLLALATAHASSSSAYPECSDQQREETVVSYGSSKTLTAHANCRGASFHYDAQLTLDRTSTSLRFSSELSYARTISGDELDYSSGGVGNAYLIQRFSVQQGVGFRAAGIINHPQMSNCQNQAVFVLTRKDVPVDVPVFVAGWYSGPVTGAGYLVPGTYEIDIVFSLSTCDNNGYNHSSSAQFELDLRFGGQVVLGDG